jgi:hypothetical protein
MSAVQSSTALYVHSFVFFLLVTGFNPAWFGHYGFLEDERLVRQAGEKHLRCAPFGWCSERDYGAGPKMAHVTADTCCQVWRAWGVQDGSSTVYEPNAPPRGTATRTGGPALGPADRSLLSSVYCGTDAATG